LGSKDKFSFEDQRLDLGLDKGFLRFVGKKVRNMFGNGVNYERK
jgi:hypothetical protein